MDRGIVKSSAWLPAAHHTRAIISFIQWSQGGVVLDAALEDIVEAFEADCAVVSRVWLSKSNSRVAARSDCNRDPRKKPLTVSFAAEGLGALVKKAKLGSVFSIMQDNGDPSDISPAITDWLSHRRLKDIIFICLDRQGAEVDFLEFHFGNECHPSWKAGIDAIAPELSRIFRERRAGLITEALSRQSVVPMAKSSVGGPMLGPDNPAGLTRTEWRVCVLISRGLSAQAICQELDIGRATLRTHLKHIYSKTSLDNFHMLARRLVSVDEREALHGSHRQASA